MDTIQAPSNNVIKNVVEPPQKTFFFERHDGSIISVTEQEAWSLLQKKQKIVGVYITPPKLIGVSDGTKFRQAVAESHELHALGDMTGAISRLRLGEKEELEAARGHLEMPRNFDTVDKHGRPVSIRTGELL